jgi:hypothetical protein
VNEITVGQQRSAFGDLGYTDTYLFVCNTTTRCPATLYCVNTIARQPITDL